MNLLTEHSGSVGSGDGGLGGDAAVLAVPVEWMRWCDRCQDERRFVAELECDTGLFGECLGCGAKSIAPFTRENSEVA
jgi:hypothetical protein